MDVEERAFSQRHLLKGDLIVEKSGGSDNNPVGRAILYEGENRIFAFSNFTMILRVKDKNVVSSSSCIIISYLNTKKELCGQCKLKLQVYITSY